MAVVGICLPTVAGREEAFERTLAAFEASVPDGFEFDILTPDEHDTVGAAWNTGAAELYPDLEDGDYLFFAIDDATPHRGWCEVAAQTADAGYLPAPRMLFADGRLESCGSMGFGALLPEAPDCTPCRNTGLVFIRREWWRETGEFLPIHYGCDDDWTFRSAINGHPVMYRSGMVFTHHHVEASDAHGTRNASLALEHHHQALSHVTTLTYPGSAAAALRPPVDFSPPLATR